jgi:hypothetical protein
MPINALRQLRECRLALGAVPATFAVKADTKSRRNLRVHVCSKFQAIPSHSKAGQSNYPAFQVQRPPQSAHRPCTQSPASADIICRITLHFVEVRLESLRQDLDNTRNFYLGTKVA